MAGIGGFGSFAGGFAQGFLPAMHQQQELQLERQRLQAQQQRELMAKADEQRKQMMDLIGETIAAEKAQNHDEKTIMSGPISKIIPVLERLTKSSGMDPSLIGPQIGMMIARPTAYDIAFGNKYGKQQQQLQQAQGQYAQASQDAFAGAMATDVSDPARQATMGAPSAAPLPFMGGQGQPSAGPNLPPQVSSIIGGGQQQNAGSAGDPLLEDIQRYTFALTQARTPAEKQAMHDLLQGAIKEKAQAEHMETRSYKDADGVQHFVFINKRSGEVRDSNGNPWVPPAPQGGENDASAIADAIQNGKQPPYIKGFYRQGSKIAAELSRRKVDLTQMQFEFSAAQKQIASLNGPQMIRFAGLAKSVLNTMGEVEDLATKLGQSGVTWANWATLQTKIKSFGNTPEGQLAVRYVTAVTALKSELANLEKGGYDPTESTFKLADQQINQDFGDKEMLAAIREAQRIVRFRLMAIPGFDKRGPDAPNRYNQSSGEQKQITPDDIRNMSDEELEDLAHGR